MTTAPIIRPAGPGTSVPSPVVRPAAAAVAAPAAAPRAFRVHRIGQRLPGLSGPPTADQLEMLARSGDMFLNAACDALAPVLGWGFAVAELCAERRISPAGVYGIQAATRLARTLFSVGRLIPLRQRISSGAWEWIVYGDTLAVVDSAERERQEAGAAPLGWIPDSYVTGGVRRPVTFLDRLQIGSGMIGLGALIAGPEAAGVAAVEAGISAASEPATAAAAAGIVGRNVSPAAARAIAETSSAWRYALHEVLRSQVIRYTATAIAAVGAASYVPDAIESFRGATTRATEQATDSAAGVVKWGLEHNDREMVERGLSGLQTFQKQADDSGKYLWLAGGLVAGEFMRRR